MFYTLIPHWTYTDPVPQIRAKVKCKAGYLMVDFDVIDPPDCFRQTCTKDGDPCWQDSCVEVFVQSPVLGGYFNFETNPNGVTLAEFGTGRGDRRPFEPWEYDRLKREVWQTPTFVANGYIHWGIRIAIELDMMQIRVEDGIEGNLYKCASLAERPIYLSLHPVLTPTPDFHRPEYFGTLV